VHLALDFVFSRLVVESTSSLLDGMLCAPYWVTFLLFADNQGQKVPKPTDYGERRVDNRRQRDVVWQFQMNMTSAKFRLFTPQGFI